MKQRIFYFIGVFLFSIGVIMSIASLAIAPAFIIYRIRDGTFEYLCVLEGIGLWFISDVVSSMIAAFGWIFALYRGER